MDSMPKLQKGLTTDSIEEEDVESVESSVQQTAHVRQEKMEDGDLNPLD